jgi:hypothetical protein
MKPDYLAFVATIIAAFPCFLLALWEKPPPWLRVTCGLTALAGAILAGIAAMGVSNESASLITGGDGFCYVVNEGVPSAPFPAIVIHDGEYPLYDVQMRIVDLLEPFSPMTLPGQSKPLDQGLSFPLGNFSPKGSILMSKLLPAKGDKASFNIFFSARNGFWIEDLRLRFINGEWKKALQVFHDNGPYPEANLSGGR